MMQRKNFNSSSGIYFLTRYNTANVLTDRFTPHQLLADYFLKQEMLTQTCSSVGQSGEQCKPL